MSAAAHSLASYNQLCRCLMRFHSRKSSVSVLSLLSVSACHVRRFNGQSHCWGWRKAVAITGLGCPIVWTHWGFRSSAFWYFHCRSVPPLVKAIKSIQTVFDVHLGVRSCGDAADLGAVVAEGRHTDLPMPIAFRAPLPANSKVDFLHCDLGGGQVSILKVGLPPPSSDLSGGQLFVCRDAFVPVFRAGPWNIKKGIQYLLTCMGGYQVRWHALEEKQLAANAPSSNPKWNPSNHEIQEGVDFINTYAPECDARNEQTFMDSDQYQDRFRNSHCRVARSKSPTHGPKQKQGPVRCRQHDSVPADNVQLEALPMWLFATSSVSIAPQFWLDATWMPWRWQDPIGHCHGHGPR